MLKRKLMPVIARAITSDTLLDWKRQGHEKKRQNKPHCCHVYVRINDPYSYLLMQVLPELSRRFDVKFVFHTVLTLDADMYPAPQLWLDNALDDVEFLAKLYELKACQRLSDWQDAVWQKKVSAQLLHWELQPGFLQLALPLFNAWWRGDKTAVEQLLDPRVVKHPECYHQALKFNERRLADEGHYMSAMLHYGGEWYWGVDRLDHLERRWNDLEIYHQLPLVQFDKTYSSFCQLLPKQSEALLSEPLQLFYSARSPYSYLGLERAVLLAQHYKVRLDVRPVLPMVMRNMSVPRQKGLYILGDTKREAKKLGLPFGYFADPLGAGVERCYALFDYAKSEHKEIEYLLSFARGVYSQGLDAATDAGLQRIVERAGLSWDQARPLLGDDSWRAWAQENLADMYDLDQWGVPTIAYGKTSVFGQDRLGVIEKKMVEELTLE